jgi:glycosyltransferase involved in cell wall biosynthesis
MSDRRDWCSRTTRAGREVLRRSRVALLPRRRRTRRDDVASIPLPKDARGLALVSYIRETVSLSDVEAAALTGHSNGWESREIARALYDVGYGVDAIDWNDDDFEASRDYDLVLAIDRRLERLGHDTHASRLLLHVTGSYPRFQNAAEQRRIEELEERRGVACVPRREIEDEAAFDRAMQRATSCSLLGNAFTLSTFPEQFRSKITLLPVTASQLARIKAPAEFVPPEREFLWFFGSGAIHKGLDRALEAFARTPRMTLHVVGNISAETDFVDAYRRELTELENIRWHGYLDPASRAFEDIAGRSVAFVAPSCSEGTSPAVTTMLQLGLYPIISRETGVTLPPDAGALLESSSVDEVEGAALTVLDRPAHELAAEIEQTQALALAIHSRENFASAVRDYLRSAHE